MHNELIYNIFEDHDIETRIDDVITFILAKGKFVFYYREAENFVNKLNWNIYISLTYI